MALVLGNGEGILADRPAAKRVLLRRERQRRRSNGTNEIPR